MFTEFGYLLAFLTGISGTFHCLGMCSGLAGGYFAGHGWAGMRWDPLIYHGVRILSYSLLGVAGTLLGRVLIQTGFLGKGQGILFMLAGLLVIAIGLWLSGLLPWKKSPQCPKQAGGACVKPLGFWKTGKSLPWVAGLINGLVPCSLVFSVAVKATATGDPIEAGLLMLFFGLGTLPSMLSVSLGGALLGERAKGVMARLAGIGVALLGGWTLYEGWVFYDVMRGLADF